MRLRVTWFIAGAVRQALENERRWDLIESAVGSIDDQGHAWDGDPAAWVLEQRGADHSRVG